MWPILQMTLGVLAGNLLTLGVLFTLVHYGLLGVEQPMVAAPEDDPAPAIRAEPAASPSGAPPPREAVQTPVEPEPPPPRGVAKVPSGPQRVRISIPGRPVEECLEPGQELNDQVVRCTAPETITLSAPEPITDVGSTARSFLRDGCQGPDWAGDAEMQRKMCDLYERIERYGYTVVP